MMRWPTRQDILAHPRLAGWRHRLAEPRLWHVNRHSIPPAIFVGICSALIPGPFQMLAAAWVALRWRLHLPTALGLTLLSNPLTILPIYWAGYRFGCWLFRMEPLRRATLEARRNRLGERPYLFAMEPDESWDIDEELDFLVADLLLRHRQGIS